jgi:hypothetical protein
LAFRWEIGGPTKICINERGGRAIRRNLAE